MALQQGIVLGLVLCLAQLHSAAQQEFQTLPSISVQPGPKVLLGESVTIVCKGPDWVTSFRLEKTHREDGTRETHKNCHSQDLNCGPPDQTRMNCYYMDQKNVSKDGLHKTKAQFLIQAVCEDSAGSYQCLYYRGSDWSVSSEPLKLEVISKNNSDPKSVQDIPWMFIITGISIKVVLLLLLFLLLVHLRHRREHRSTSVKLRKQKPQDRVTPAAEVSTGTPVKELDVVGRSENIWPPSLLQPQQMGLHSWAWPDPHNCCCRSPRGGDLCSAEHKQLVACCTHTDLARVKSCTYASVVRH